MEHGCKTLPLQGRPSYELVIFTLFPSYNVGILKEVDVNLPTLKTRVFMNWMIAWQCLLGYQPCVMPWCIEIKNHIKYLC